MTTNDHFARLLADALADVAPTREPDRLFTETIRAARRANSRPRWFALMKEPPMRLSSGASVGSPTVRLTAIVGLTMALLLALGAAAAVGASFLPSPVAIVPLPPFGPAGNGSLAYSDKGDIYLADADGTNPRAIIAGDTIDASPGFSHDGTKLAFARGPVGDLTLMVATADGTDPQQLLTTIQWGDFTPSDRAFVVTHTVDGKLVLSIVDVDGQHAITNVDVGDIVLRDWVMPRPLDGQELVFVGSPHGDLTQMGLYGIRPDSTGIRTIGNVVTGETQTTPQQSSLKDPSLSPDGSSIAYWSWETHGGVTNGDVHLRDLDTGADRLVQTSTRGAFGVMPRFSPDGSQLLVRDASTGPSQLLLAPVDGHEAGTCQRCVGPAHSGHAGRGGSTSRPRSAYGSTDSGQGHTIGTGGIRLHHPTLPELLLGEGHFFHDPLIVPERAPRPSPTCVAIIGETVPTQRRRLQR